MNTDRTIYFGVAGSSDGKEGGGSDGKERSTDGGHYRIETNTLLTTKFVF